MDEMTLAAMKCMKILAAMDKGYSREPWEEYPIFMSQQGDHLTLAGFVRREYRELMEALLNVHVEANQDTFDGLPEVIFKAQLEIADVANCLDFLFESLARLRGSLPQ